MGHEYPIKKYGPMNTSVKVIKIGGGVIEDPKALQAFCKSFSALEGPKILVHGGGKSASVLAEKLGVPTKMVEGRRITPKDSLEVITMSYAGTANKTIVAALQAYNCNALGLSGADANSVLATKRPVHNIDYGFVGDIEKVNAPFIKTLLNMGICPVFCALTHDGNGQLLNTNADTIASSIAVAMAKDYHCSLWYCFEKEGVLSDLENNIVIPSLSEAHMHKEIAAGVIQAGMIPKLQNGFNALKGGVKEVLIGNESLLKGNRNATRLRTHE